MASGCRRMGESTSYQKPSTVSGEAQARLRPMRGLKTDHTASVVIRGHAFIQNLRRGHYALGADTGNRHLRVATAFEELLGTI
jgi:hypothetical protein